MSAMVCNHCEVGEISRHYGVSHGSVLCWPLFSFKLDNLMAHAISAYTEPILFFPWFQCFMRAFSSNFDAIRIVENGQYEKGKKGDENVRLLLHSAKSLDGVSSTEDYSALLYNASLFIIHCTVHSVHCTVLHCTVYGVLCTVNSASLYSVLCILVYCTYV